MQLHKKKTSPVFLEADSFKCISIYQFHYFNFPWVLCSFSTVFISEFKRALWSFGKCYVIFILVWETAGLNVVSHADFFVHFRTELVTNKFLCLKSGFQDMWSNVRQKNKFKGYEKDNSASLNINKCLQSTFPNLRCFINNQIPFYITQITCIYLLILEF